MDDKSKSDQWLLLRSSRDVPESLKTVLNILSFNVISTTKIYSDKFMKTKCPGDASFFETVTVNGQRDEALNFISNMLSLMSQEVLLKQREASLWMRSICIGFDQRYNYSISESTSSEDLIQITVSLKQASLIDDTGYAALINEVDDYKKYREVLRQYRTIRWSLGEIIAGQKTLPMNKTISLNEAISMDGLVHIELISLMDPSSKIRHIDFYQHYKCYESDGRVVPINKVSETMEELYREMMKFNVAQYTNPVMLMRTFWIYSQMFDNQKNINSLNEFLRTELMIVNQMYNDVVILYELISEDILPDEKIVSILTVELINISKQLLNHTSSGVSSNGSSSISIFQKYNDQIAKTEIYSSVYRGLLSTPPVYSKENCIALLAKMYQFFVEATLTHQNIANFIKQVGSRLSLEKRKEFVFAS